MKVFCWNVQSRVETTLGHQLKGVLDCKPDIIAVQELTTETLPGWERGLTAENYGALSTLDLVSRAYPKPPYPTPPFPRPRGRVHTHIQRRNFNLTAARHPMSELPGLSFEDADEERFAFPEKYLAVRVDMDGVGIDVHNAHLPHGSGRGVIKVHAFEAICRRLDEESGTPRILCGDFNAPWSEDEKGPLITRGGKWPEDVQTRWVRAETALFNISEMRDVYRDVHEPGQPLPVSHFTGRRAPFTPHRYDYIFASRQLKTECCRYLSEWLQRDERRWRPSDHSPVVAELSLRPELRP